MTVSDHTASLDNFATPEEVQNRRAFLNDSEISLRAWQVTLCWVKRTVVDRYPCRWTNGNLVLYIIHEIRQ